MREEEEIVERGVPSAKRVRAHAWQTKSAGKTQRHQNCARQAKRCRRNGLQRACAWQRAAGARACVQKVRRSRQGMHNTNATKRKNKNGSAACAVRACAVHAKPTANAMQRQKRSSSIQRCMRKITATRQALSTQCVRGKVRRKNACVRACLMRAHGRQSGGAQCSRHETQEPGPAVNSWGVHNAVRN